MASLIIRPAALSDAADLGIIHYQSWLQTYTGLIDPDFLSLLSAQRSQQRFEAEGCKLFLSHWWMVLLPASATTAKAAIQTLTASLVRFRQSTFYKNTNIKELEQH